MVSVQYTPIPQQEVIIHPSNGMSSFATITTDSYLSMNLHGQMQNAAPYIGWTLDQWIQAITADAQQRCAAYPESCAGTTPEQLGAKWGAIAFQLMQGVSVPVQTQQSTPMQTPVATVPAQTTINIPVVPINNPPGVYIQTTGSGDIGIPGIPNPSLQPDYLTQGKVSQGAVSDNTTQSQIAASGGTPVAPNIPPGTWILPSSLSWLGNTFAIAGYNIPIWIALAGVVGLMFVSGSGGGGRHRRF